MEIFSVELLLLFLIDIVMIGVNKFAVLLIIIVYEVII